MITVLHDDILLFKNIIPIQLAKDIVNRVNMTNTTDCMAMYDQQDLYDRFNKLWYDVIEPLYMNYYFQRKPDGTSFLFNYTVEELNGFIKYASTTWRDMFVLKYYYENTVNLYKLIHCDFSTLTFSAGLIDSTLFDGGRLCFPRQKVNVKLDLGDLVIFPGGLTHPHYTETVTRGIRMNLVGQSMPYKNNGELGHKHD